MGMELGFLLFGSLLDMHRIGIGMGRFAICDDASSDAEWIHMAGSKI
jgi:hypothetical protein